MEHKLTHDEIEQIMRGEAGLIDVRTQAETPARTYRYAIPWDVQQMVQGRFPDIAKDRPVFVFDGLNSQSAVAVQLMLAEGFMEVHNIGSHDSLPAELAV